jgi:acyl carrier protein phosphodiesterase
MLPAMRADDWLASYREVETIAHALDRMAARLTRANPLPGAGEELLADYAGFETDFRIFIVEASEFAEDWRQARGG